MEDSSFLKLNEKLIQCRLCPRLVQFRETSPVLKEFTGQCYWRRPVPGFGDNRAWLMLLGLAPSPQGGNRTGRIFTGDKSAQFLMKALFEEELSNQPTSTGVADGLKLFGCYITAAVKCVPPKHKPSPVEIKTCLSNYLFEEMKLLNNLKAVLALGRLAFDAYLLWARSIKTIPSKLAFKHGACYPLEGLPTLYASYHPSPQNTNTGVMTHQMFVNLLKKIKSDNHDKRA